MLRTVIAGARERASPMELLSALQQMGPLKYPRREPGVASWARDQGFRCGISAATVRTARGSSGLSQA